MLIVMQFFGNIMEDKIMEKTVDDLIKELQALRPELRKLPVIIQAENGLLFEPVIKRSLGKHETIIDEPKQMIITY